MVYGIKKGALRRVPFNAPMPVRVEGQSDEDYARLCAPVVALNKVNVVVRNRGRTKAIEIQAKAKELEKAGEGGVRASAEMLIRETVVGLEPYIVVDPDHPDQNVDLAPGIDVEQLIEELDGQHLLEGVALVGLTGQAPSPSQSNF